MGIRTESLWREKPLSSALIGQVERLMNKKVFSYNFILQDSALQRTGSFYFKSIGP
jgi:hypothetical protein